MTIQLTAAESAAADRVESSMRSLQSESIKRIEVAFSQPRRIRERRRNNLLKFLLDVPVTETTDLIVRLIK
jgi:hypothetical protein